jgi:hypothetical protein
LSSWAIQGLYQATGTEQLADIYQSPEFTLHQPTIKMTFFSDCKDVATDIDAKLGQIIFACITVAAHNNSRSPLIWSSVAEKRRKARMDE